MRNLLFIPTYRCRSQIERTLKSIGNLAEFFHEILIVDNVSDDGTASTAQDCLEKFHFTNARVVVNPTNVGLGGSHKLAFEYAVANNFDHVVILHGDDQGNLHDITPLLKTIHQRESECFWMGARFHPASQLIGYSKFRILGNLVFNALASILKTKMIYDLGGSGVNIFPIRLIREHPFAQYSNDLTFHVYLLLNAYQLKQPVNFTPISWREDDQISNVKLVRQSLKLLTILKAYFRNSDVQLDQATQFKSSCREWKTDYAAFAK